jgi:hypothetical protein
LIHRQIFKSRLLQASHVHFGSALVNIKLQEQGRFHKPRLGGSSLCYTTNGPSGLYPGLEPMCSTRPVQLSPRK